MIGLEINDLFDDYLVGDKRSSLRCSQFSHSSFLQNKHKHICYDFYIYPLFPSLNKPLARLP